MKVLAIDYGEKRIGLAISDELGLIAAPMPVLEVKSLADAVSKVHLIANKQRVDRILIGLALGMDRAETQQSIRTRYFAQSLRTSNNIKIDFWNESFSTHQAKSDKRGRTSKKKRNIDSEAARIILQEYLNAKKENSQKQFVVPQHQSNFAT